MGRLTPTQTRTPCERSKSMTHILAMMSASMPRHTQSRQSGHGPFLALGSPI